MTTLVFQAATESDSRTRLLQRLTPRRIAAELLAREARLARCGFLLLALILPMAVALGFDDRMLRGAPIWIKPIKFALSIAVLALTTAWFIGHLRPDRRRGPAIDRIVRLLIATASFELGYITLQAALGQASHYNVGDAFHGAMYTLMAIGALALTATQAMLAWELRRHADPSRPAVYRLSVQIGLSLAFAFGSGAGMLLGGMQPPDAGAHSIPLLGWPLAGGDLRPAHFIGLHAEQLLPLIGLALAGLPLRRAMAGLGTATVAYSALFAFAVAWGLAGRI